MRQPLAEALVALAETPDDVPGIADDLQKVARLAADRIAAVDYAAIVRRPDDGSCVVAASGDLVQGVDSVTRAAQDSMGPPDACQSGAGTMSWPNFRDTATELGLGATSVPLFTGSGTAVASLDLYGRDPDRLAPLAAGIGAAYDPDLPWPEECDDTRMCDAGCAELIAGFTEALSVRQSIQLAVVLLGASEQTDPAEAYLKLRVRAAAEGLSLLAAASAVIAPTLAGPATGPD
ncbi:hypothetical protein MB27_20485 [Actinoplanes utahensis]|uniref:ANTAR domain-containing protein n=1 Tax=Actinoplanes utahensis TaxID=1869 RepID=A0A0A6UL96_ACTUT|nr:hypothetical protein MB27_20485 [Actinoplanes utahensis]